MVKVVMVEGGIGRVISAVPAVEELASKEEVIVVTHWADVFANNPKIKRLYQPNSPYLFEDVIQKNDVICPEPYHLPAYYRDEIHLVNAFHKLINGNEPEGVDEPSLYLRRDEINSGETIIQSIKQKNDNKPVIAFQFVGAGFNPQSMFDPTNRSLPEWITKRIVEEIDAIFINCGHIGLPIPRVITKENTPIRELFSIINSVDYVIGIDSFMCHVAAAFKKAGTFFYGSTSPKQLGYSRFQNIQRAGYPKGHKPFRFAHDEKVSDGAMDFSKEDVDMAIDAIKKHLKKCLPAEAPLKVFKEKPTLGIVKEKDCVTEEAIPDNTPIVEGE